MLKAPKQHAKEKWGHDQTGIRAKSSSLQAADSRGQEASYRCFVSIIRTYLKDSVLSDQSIYLLQGWLLPALG